MSSKPESSRRDFIDGIDRTGRNVPDGSIGQDPRALRGGNVPSVFSIAHWLRDRRLTFGSDRVVINASEHDSWSGELAISDTGATYDVIIVGSGMSGLAAAFYITRRRPGTTILILDCKPAFGGNAGRDDMPPIPLAAATAGAYAVAPYADFLHEIYDAIGFEWQKYLVAAPMYSYFFDEHTPYALQGRRWSLDVYGAGIDTMPYPPEVIRDLHTAKATFVNWYDVAGGPMDPADRSDPKFAYLSQMSLHDYLTGTLGLHPAVSDFYTRFSVDALAGTTRDVNAFTGISFLSAEYHAISSPPGGTSAIARHLHDWLVGIGAKSAADVRIRQSAMVLRTDTDGRKSSATYFLNGHLFKASSRSLIVASQGYAARMVVDHLVDEETRRAWSEFVFVPVVTANVVLRSAKPLLELGLGYDNYWWGSRYWADFVIADWTTENRDDPDRPTVLTFFGGNPFPPEEMANERVKLLTTPFETYEQSIREDLTRILARTAFDFDRDVTGIYVYRWGHGMIFPKVGFPFGGNGVSPRHIARRQLGTISFAGQDTESSPGIESAIASGLRTASEVLSQFE